MPPVYLVASKTRAIVACNFFLPYPGDKKKYVEHDERVRMIGFDTCDYHIVQSVRAEIDMLRSRIRDHTPVAGEEDTASTQEEGEGIREADRIS